MNQSHRRRSCRLCNSRDLELVLPIASSAIADEYITKESLNKPQTSFPLDIFLCKNCKHLQLLDVVAPEILFRNYTYVTKISLGLVEHFRKLSKHLILGLGLSPSSLIIEMGSNDGTLLQFLKSEGYRVLGIDPALEIAKRATESGVETLPDFFTSQLASQIQTSQGSASLFIANNVFAHADNLVDIVEGIRLLLSPEGVFVFEVSYMGDIVEKMLWDTIYHEHLSYHTIAPLISFFEKHGMELFDLEHLPTKGGSLRDYVQLVGGTRPITPAVHCYLESEKKRALDQSSTYFCFADRIQTLKKNLLVLLAQLRDEGKSIAGYGASATVTTLLHHLDLGDKLDFIVDDNISKQGTYSPGHHIPVFSPIALQEKKPDYVIILAWMYATPIIEKNKNYLNSGGHFIIPNPTIQVI